MTERAYEAKKGLMKTGRNTGDVDLLIEFISEGDVVPQDMNRPLRSIIATILADYTSKINKVATGLEECTSSIKKLNEKYEKLGKKLDDLDQTVDPIKYANDKIDSQGESIRDLWVHIANVDDALARLLTDTEKSVFREFSRYGNDASPTKSSSSGTSD